jgi:hypothetical protein
MMFGFFQKQLRKRRSQATAPSIPEPSPGLNGNRARSTAPRFDATKWLLANPWLAEGQADDRNPMNGAVSATSGTPAEQRSFARRTHQKMFKKWSQARHD